MARVSITLAEKFVFSTQLNVRVTDINYGKHLSNDAVLGMMHEARVQFLSSMGYTEMDFGGYGIIMTDCAVQYKAEAFLGDKLSIEVGVHDFNRYGFDLTYRISRDEDQKVISLGKTGIICFDYEAKKIAPLSEKIKAQLNSL